MLGVSAHSRIACHWCPLLRRVGKVKPIVPLFRITKIPIEIPGGTMGTVLCNGAIRSKGIAMQAAAVVFHHHGRLTCPHANDRMLQRILTLTHSQHGPILHRVINAHTSTLR